MRRWGVPFLLLTLAVSCVQARGHAPRLPERHASFVEDADAFVFRVMEDDQGGFYALWTHVLPDKTYSLVAQHVDTQGRPLWKTPGLMVERNLLTADNWDAATDGKSGFLLTWIENGRARGQRVGPDGAKLWPERAGVTTSSSTAAAPEVIPDAAGGAFFTWSERRYPDRWVIMSQHLDDKGLAIWPVQGSRVSLRPSDQRRPKPVYDGAAGLIVAWKDFFENASQLWIQRMDYQGNRLWGAQGEVVVAPADNNPRTLPLVTSFGEGGAAAAWVAQSGNASRIYLQSVDPQGRFRWGAQGMSISYGTWNEWNPKLGGDGEGTIWVGWEDYRNFTHWQAFLGMLDRNGHSTWPASEVALAPTLADQGQLAFTEDGRKGVFAAWVDNRSGAPGIYAQEIDNTGNALLGQSGRTIAEGLVDPGQPQIVSLAPGRTAVFYADQEKKGHWVLYWHGIDGPRAAPAPAPAPSSVNEPSSGAGEGMVP